MLTAIVIDDEQYARDELMALIEEQTALSVEVIEDCPNAIEGLKAIHRHKPDIIFVDIEMPQISGIELLGMLDPAQMPKVIFVTAFEEYALQAFEGNAFDYILKPVEPSRLHKTLQRVQRSQSRQDLHTLIEKPLSLIPCAGFNRYVLIQPADVEVAYSDQSGVHILSQRAENGTQQSSCSLSLKMLQAKTDLLRCHRQYLINPHMIREIRLLDNGLAEIITLGKHVVPVSRRYLKELKDHFQLH